MVKWKPLLRTGMEGPFICNRAADRQRGESGGNETKVLVGLTGSHETGSFYVVKRVGREGKARRTVHGLRKPSARCGPTDDGCDRSRRNPAHSRDVVDPHMWTCLATFIGIGFRAATVVNQFPRVSFNL